MTDSVYIHIAERDQAQTSERSAGRVQDASRTGQDHCSDLGRVEVAHRAGRIRQLVQAGIERGSFQVVQRC